MAGFTATAIAASSLAGVGLSFAQAAKQSELQKKAEAAANEAMAEAKKRIDINFYEKLGVNKDIYDKEREAMLAQGAQAIQGAMETGEGAAAAAGRVYMAQQESQADITRRQSEEVSRLQQLAAQGDAEASKMLAQLYLGEVEGAQQASAYAQQAKAQALQSGVGALTSGMSSLAAERPLYPTQKDASPPEKTPTTQNQKVFGESGVPFADPNKINPVKQPWMNAFGFNTYKFG